MLVSSKPFRLSAAFYSACAVASIFAVRFAGADAIHLQDGSLIRGTIVSIGDDTVSIETTYAGTLNVTLKEITGIDTDASHDVSLKSGVAESGRFVWKNGHQEIVGEGNTVVPISLADLAKSAPHPPDDTNAPPPDWNGRVDLSLTGDEGNTNKVNAMTSATVNRSTIDDRLQLKLRAQYEENSGDIEKNEATGLVHFEHDITRDVFFFTRLSLEYDEFEQVDIRARFAAGFGRYVIRQPKQDLRLHAGLGYEFERFSEGSNDSTPLLGAGYSYRLDVRNWLQFDSNFFFFFNATDLGDFHFDAENGAEMPLGRGSNWKVRLGIRNEYDSRPLDGIKSLDTSYYLSLVYTWD